jgi:hypothetical protein
MSQHSGFNLELFQAEVLEKVQVLEEMPKREAEIAELSKRVASINRKGRGGLDWWFSFAMLKVSEMLLTRTIRGYKKDKQGLKYRAQAGQLLGREEVRRHLCPFLPDAGGDVRRIAEAVTSALVPPALTGAVSIPLDPLFFALLSQELVRIGAARYCADAAERGRS